MSALPQPVPVATTAAKSARIPSGRIALVLAAVIVVANLFGASYYLAPIAERVRSPLHSYLKPSGWIGQSLGLLAVSGFLFLWLYPLRKRVRGAKQLGSVARWLDVHLIVGLLIPLIAATHAAWRFSGLIGLGWVAMFIVWASGVAGRYIYVRIPRTRDGLAMSLDDVRLERLRLLHEIVATSGLSLGEVESALQVAPIQAERLGLIGTVRQFVRDDWKRRRDIATLLHRLEQLGTSRLDRRSLRAIARLARRQMSLHQEMRMLDATQRIFKFWHVAHLPVALTALLAVLLHVVVAVVTGATWFY
ncbi:MAG: hypothetical protein U0527_06545 [Candidatus Eisenbacteria bacterium]